MLALALWHRDGGRCWRCGLAIELEVPATMPGGLTIGHVIPRSLARDELELAQLDAIGNLSAEHRRCNLSAGARPPRVAAAIVTP